ncbi:MAG: hypothetical protein ACREL7_18610 [Longimicrobiales bacterium]
MQANRVLGYRVIRIALVSGVAFFGLVVWYLATQRTIERPAPELVRSLQLAFVVLALGALGVIAFVRSAQAKARTFEQKGTYAMLAWVVGEGVALFGGVIYLLTTRPVLYLTGVAILLGALLVVPVPEDR